ncbi:unnamed protein product [Pleuronectes platessa]|uniref:Uncharacterized protein n=1 Tax=Pleuronectes platessa TaxID=8262 RepID=A0A9N7UIG9_PLEPL|nr:unnamed protein product [Pleuronectes platessa]
MKGEERRGRLRSIRTKTGRHKSSFFPASVGLINKARDPHLTQTFIPPPHLKDRFRLCDFSMPQTLRLIRNLGALITRLERFNSQPQPQNLPPHPMTPIIPQTPSPCPNKFTAGL